MITERTQATAATERRRAKAEHSAADLRYAAVNPDELLIYFTAPSASRPGRVNEVALCVATGATHCTCKAAECGHRCWHAATVAAAWASHPAMRDVYGMPDRMLLAYGSKARAMLATYRERTGTVLPMDALNYVAARAEWARRHPTPSEEDLG